MIGSPTGPCPPSPRRGYSSAKLELSSSGSATGISPNKAATSPKQTPTKAGSPAKSAVGTPKGQSASSFVSPRSLDKKSSLRAQAAAKQDSVAVYRREGKVCVHADTANNLTVYPTFLIDADGEVVIHSVPKTFDMSATVSNNSKSLNAAAKAVGIIIASTPAPSGDQVKVGTFFQVSPTRGIASFHLARGPVSKGGDPNSLNPKTDLWISKACTMAHWQTLFSNPKTRQKYFCKVKVSNGFCEKRKKLLLLETSTFTEPCSGIVPVVPLDMAIIDLPADIGDQYLIPVPYPKIKGLRKVAVIAYNQTEARDDDRRSGVYGCTAGIPSFDDEYNLLHMGGKTVSPGLVVVQSLPSNHYIASEVSLGEGSPGAPLIPITMAHYFWGVHSCAFQDNDPAGGTSKSRNFNVAIDIRNPAFVSLYQAFVLKTLPEAEQATVGPSLAQEPKED